MRPPIEPGASGGDAAAAAEAREREASAEAARRRLEQIRAAAEAARDAERREREWLGQHRGGAGGIAAREAAERLEGERALRAGQDEEFKASLLADAARDAQRRAADAARRQAVELRAALRATLPPEPPAGAGAVRVRGLEDLPESWSPGRWCLATSLPRVLLQDRAQPVSAAAGGATSLALFLVQL
ncbi:hypothetical protein MNEG_11777 [Monoraphidium neglectum]|uniref:Uncharacterized protein n=1 Tax=Monoraphidium neglectum TaxID=145388 RepID=A0A0D2J8Y6_9CHLO|nr:hypothetical protein MNEG_11777 [Monoraphidium neglectum]KIY96187.1 hypothetical protein MNEG_11777 [Monoraphidium neglectum]|eukprot:XP_013895207.1 hypothetical protein MNEG_11777 [Monoraphidium neglectum]